MSRCSKTKPFVNVEDAGDVLVLRCDWPAGHGGKRHHDPDKQAEWFE